MKAHKKFERDLNRKVSEKEIKEKEE